MNYLKYGCFLILGISAFIILILAFRGKGAFKTLFLNALLGVMTLIIINLTAKFSGAYIPINEYTAGLSAVFGLPAVCAFLLLRIIFI